MRKKVIVFAGWRIIPVGVMAYHLTQPPLSDG